MRIEMYSAPDRCLSVHEPDLGDRIDRRWLWHGERRLSLRDLTEDDPTVNEVAEVVLTSSDDPDWIPRIRDGRLFFSISSAERLLDHDWGKGVCIRDNDTIGVITGPVDRIVFLDITRSWPAGDRNRIDRTVRHMRRPWRRR